MKKYLLLGSALCVLGGYTANAEVSLNVNLGEPAYVAPGYVEAPAWPSAHYDHHRHPHNDYWAARQRDEHEHAARDMHAAAPMHAPRKTHDNHNNAHK